MATASSLYLPAGSNKQSGAGGTAKECLTFTERPTTPPEVKKYRKSSYLEPGARFKHYGIVDDLKKMNLDEKTFGEFSDPGEGTAQDLINHKKLTLLQKIDLEKAEKCYKGTSREPLGKTYDRKVVLPEKHTKYGVPFGVTSKSSLEPAKGIIWPEISEETLAGEDLYRRSHGTCAAGEQKRRGYNWPLDPTAYRFGVKGDTIALNGVSKNVYDILHGAGDIPSCVNTKRVEDFRNMTHILGQTKNLGQNSSSRPFDTVYGKPSASGRATKGTWGAADVIKGAYSKEAQKPDADLGKSITPGFRNITLEDRAYGCPSIRTDLPAGPAARRSLADSQNYGDDVPAQDLINPPAFSDLAIAPTAMAELRPKQKIIDLFNKIGLGVEDQIADILFDEASGGREFCSVNSYRHALNRYLIALETNSLDVWYQEHNLL